MSPSTFNLRITTIVLVVFGLVALTQFFIHTALEGKSSELQDMSGVWEICAPDKPEMANCKWISAAVPLDVPNELKKNFKGWLFYRKLFMSPEGCIQNGAACEFVIGEVGDAVEATLNGMIIGRRGNFPPEALYAKHYPVRFDFSPTSLRPSNQENELILKVYSLKKAQAGLRRGPVAIVPAGAGNRIVKARIFQSIILPILSAMGLLIFSVISLIQIVKSRENNKRLLYFFVNYSLIAAIYLMSFTEIPREYLPIALAGYLHWGLRVLQDWSLFELVREFFGYSRTWKLIFRPLYVFVLLVFIFLYFFGGAGFDGAYWTMRAAFPILILPLAMGFYGAIKNREGVSKKPMLILFGITLPMLISDILVFHQMYSFPYFVKYYPFFISATFGWVFLLRHQNEMAYLFADAQLGKLSSRIAHDIRSPLSSMRAALLMLREQCGDNKDTADSLNLLQLSGKRLNDIANGLLAKYKGDESIVQVFSIHEVLDELVGELQASPLGQGTEFKKSYVTTALYVTGDKTGINRAIGNIIKNALEAMQRNPIERPRKLVVATTFDGIQNLVIRTQDTGPGIPADKIPLILQGGYTEGKADGHGIGTKVIKEVVESHKGHLSIESQVGVGTTFIITLPATIQNDETIVTIPHAGNGVICVIDDEPSMREQWRLTLKAQGVETKAFSCWEDYTADSLNDKSATFIVDYHFDNSEVDGLEIIRRLKSDGYSQLVLATAEYWKPAIKDAAQKLGATLCPKPLPKIVIQGNKAGKTVLLIDDDEGIRISWNMLKKKFGIATLHSFPTMEAFIDANINPSNCDLCVIDKNIENSQYNGAQMLAYLKQNGAKTVVLATGEPESDIRNDPDYAAIDGIITSKIPEDISQF